MTTHEMTFEEFNIVRHEIYKSDPTMDEFTIQHTEYETHIFYGKSGNTIASWCCATGTCYILDRREAVRRLIGGIGNYCTNALDSWEDQFRDNKHPDSPVFKKRAACTHENYNFVLAADGPTDEKYCRDCERII